MFLILIFINIGVKFGFFPSNVKKNHTVAGVIFFIQTFRKLVCHFCTHFLSFKLLCLQAAQHLILKRFIHLEEGEFL